MSTDQDRQGANGRLTVAVAGANSLVGRMLLERLEQAGGVRTVALVRSPAKLPADEIIPDWMLSSAAGGAMRNADVLVNLSGELFSRRSDVYRDANVRTTELVARALSSGRARRAILVSYPGADPDSSNLFLKTKGQAERLLLDTGKEAVVFRCPAIINTPDDPGPFEENITARRDKVQTLGSGLQRWRPVYRGDVAEAIAAAVERGVPGVYDLTGPHEMTLDGLIRLVNRDPSVRISHTPALLARIIGRFFLPPTAVDILLRDATGDPSQTVAEFGLKPTSLYDLWGAKREGQPSHAGAR